MNTKEKILKLLTEGSFSVSDLSKKLGISRQMAHRHLKELLALGIIKKRGTAPHVVYFSAVFKKESLIKTSIDIFSDFLWKKYDKSFSFDFSKKVNDLRIL